MTSARATAFTCPRCAGRLPVASSAHLDCPSCGSALAIYVPGAAIREAVVPTKTAAEAAVDDPFREAPLFYGTFGLVVAVAAAQCHGRAIELRRITERQPHAAARHQPLQLAGRALGHQSAAIEARHLDHLVGNRHRPLG